MGYLCEGRSLFQCIPYDYTAYMDYMDLAVGCPRQAIQLNHSLIIGLYGLSRAV